MVPEMRETRKCFFTYHVHCGGGRMGNGYLFASPYLSKRPDRPLNSIGVRRKCNTLRTAVFFSSFVVRPRESSFRKRKQKENKQPLCTRTTVYIQYTVSTTRVLSKSKSARQNEKKTERRMKMRMGIIFRECGTLFCRRERAENQK